ncbi:MAG: Kelch repeat-containing protein [Chitinophagales bacterium]
MSLRLNQIMKIHLLRISCVVISIVTIVSCNKDEKIPVGPAFQGIVSCENRPVINARLVPVGSLSVGRSDLVAAAAGNKILFAAGYANGNGVDTIINDRSTRVDIYDISSNEWSTAELNMFGQSWDIAAASVGNKILFGGGRSPLSGSASSRIDIYDASTNTWSMAPLTRPRTGIAASALGSKVFFAGGSYTTAVDIYDESTNSWSAATLSQGRSEISATTAGNKIYFAGGIVSDFFGDTGISGTVDIFDGSTGTWSASYLKSARVGMASIATGNKIFWAGGANSNSPPSLFDRVEIRDINTDVSSFACIIPRSSPMAAIKDDNIVFFTGYGADQRNGTHFEIYNITANTWSTGVLDQPIQGAAIISVNNTIYIAGGSSNNFPPFYDKVWKLEF